MKQCSVCNESKDLNEFDRWRNAAGERVATPRCKSCRREYTNKYYAKKPSKTGLSREEWLNSVRKPKLSPEQKEELAKQKWDVWHKEELNRQKHKREDLLDKGVKQCTGCNEELPLSQFHMRTRKRKDNSLYKVHYHNCKSCRRVDNRKHENTPEGKIRKKRNRVLRVGRNRQATPKWLNPEQKQQIVDIYEHMRDCRAVTGEDYHVDHIVPLGGENICGLHVPWNLQVLPAYVNISKSNKVLPWTDPPCLLNRYPM